MLYTRRILPQAKGTQVGNKQTPAAGPMFGAADDLPLFSGTPVAVEERPFVAEANASPPAYTQPSMFADELPADQLDDLLAADAYLPGPPSPSAQRIDSAAVAGVPCRRCGGAQVYRPFTPEPTAYSTPRLYRAFAVCAKCNVAEEF
jgi:hypothetical protein